ncbi:MAG: DUF1343 domain-containing protein [Gemmatimonadota bacterium]|nr:MAG: DUF1343 domain-containing protein [Gemmatimonadota bacterium]
MVECMPSKGEEDGVRPGIEILLADSSHLVSGRRVGLITNHTGRTRDQTHSIDLLLSHGVEISALFGPEHGIRGNVPEPEPSGTADEGVEPVRDVEEVSGLPVYSLYGETLKPTLEMLSGIELLLFDIQDIGARYYTYVSTMALAMQAAAEHGITFVVLDRPNPIGGDLVQGNVLEVEHASFVGLYPVPMRHGMTVGELALLFNDRFEIGADLHVIRAAGWRRGMWFDQSGLPWVDPSPNMPSLESATHYPGTCLFEGTNLSVGRGTEQAFQQIGAPWLDGVALAERLNGYELPGVRFEAVSFTPEGPHDRKYNSELVNGVRFVATDRDVYDPTLAAVAALIEARRLAGKRWEWIPGHFDRLAGTTHLRERIEAGAQLDDVTSQWADLLEAFLQLRARYLLY